MRGMPVVAFVVSLGLILGMYSAIGMTDLVGGPQDTELQGEVEEKAEEQNDSSINPDEAGEGGFLSFTVSAIREVIGILQLIVFLPKTLEALGFPGPFATAAGHGSQIVIGIMIANAWLGDGLR
ncbi:hypothetical protein [Natronorubrum halophilum]|uniref:hypothetical protein n=1 Tax=Natronorubrum halophilum TaxID=1702106 RepID=UPI0013CEB6B4|nr:hypothetical protein [Natronorubrum halophilum]